MLRLVRWPRPSLMGLLSIALMIVALAPTASTGAVGSSLQPHARVAAQQAQERWRYAYDGAGSYEVVSSNPSEITLLVNAPGFDRTRIAVVGLNAFSGEEMWRVTSDQLDGLIDTGVPTNGELVMISTTNAIYGLDETTGAIIWSSSHGAGLPYVFRGRQGGAAVFSLTLGNAAVGLDQATGTVLWQQLLPAGSIDNAYDIEGGPLVLIGTPIVAGESVQLFGLDKGAGQILWQTLVGQTGASTQHATALGGNRAGLVAAGVWTDATSALVAVDGYTGAVRWSNPVSPESGWSVVHVTNGAQPVVIHAQGAASDVKSSTAYDAMTGAGRWQNDWIGLDAILVGETQLVGAGPVASYLDALVSVDAESGQMEWGQPYTLVQGDFAQSARIFANELIFVPSTRESNTPAVTSVDLSTGNVVWASSYPEFDWIALVGVPAGLTLIQGNIGGPDAVAIALGS